MIFASTWQRLKNRASFHYFNSRGKSLKRRNGDYTVGNPLVVGFLSSPIGIGEGSRLIRSGLENAGYDVSIFDLTPTIQPHLSKIAVPDGKADDGKGPIILHVNPSEIPKAIDLLRDRGIARRRMIGVWAWELEKIPKFWLSCQNWFDEIWSISKFSLQSFSSLSVPTIHMGYPFLEAERSAMLDWRKRLELEDVFSVLIAFDAKSSSNRKNPFAAIQAFQKAFPNTSKAKLIVKITGDFDHIIESHPGIFSARNIVIIDDVLSRKEMTDLIVSCDCFLSLSRAEGFGLTIAQAGINGIPTIVTGWSAPADWKGCPSIYFTDYQLVPINDPSKIYKRSMGRWANPDIDHAARLLKDVAVLSQGERKKISKDARAWWSKNYGQEAFQERFSEDTLRTLKKGQTS